MRMFAYRRWDRRTNLVLTQAQQASSCVLGRHIISYSSSTSLAKFSVDELFALLYDIWLVIHMQCFGILAKACNVHMCQ